MFRKLFNNKKIIILPFILISFFCMDPLIEPEEKYSDYLSGNVAELLNDPELGFPNGGFENGIEFWGGWNGCNPCDTSVLGVLDIDSTANDSIYPAEGNKSIKVTSRNGGAGLYSYFSYTPGDTLEFSFQYMIPTANHLVNNHSAFGLFVQTSITDDDANFISANEVSYSLESQDSTTSLIADGNWHTITLTSISSSIEASGTYFQIWFWEWSYWHWMYSEERALIGYLDDFQLKNKKCENPRPTDFSIIYPNNGDKFNLDTIKNFQTIPFEWEESYDSDTVLYTNKLVTKVPCLDASLSAGFEEYEEIQTFDPIANQWIYYKMPDGWGTFASNWFLLETDWANQFTTWVTDTVSRSGSHSLRMGASNLETPSHYKSLIFRLSHVDVNLDKDRIAPGTVVTIKGYAMTPAQDRLTGDNSANIMVMAFDDQWNFASGPVIDASYAANAWHPFEVSMTIPERRQFPNTTTVYIGFRYSQFNGMSGTVYFDDVTISTSEPINYFVTDYFDVLTNANNTVMSADYLGSLFNFIKSDLNGISFSEVDFQWSILATDYIREVPALNAPITFTVIDTSTVQNLSIGSQNFSGIEDSLFYEKILGN